MLSAAPRPGRNATIPRWRPKWLIRRYVNRRAANGPTISFDEFGPLEIRPQPGRSWHPSRSPDRLPATYVRKHGIRHWLAFYDIHANKLWGYTRPRKRSREVLGVLKRMRRKHPCPARIHLILDNFPPHGTPGGWPWRGHNSVHLIRTPTNASRVKPIKCRFTPVQEYVIRNLTYASHDDHLSRELIRNADYRNPHATKKS